MSAAEAAEGAAADSIDAIDESNNASEAEEANARTIGAYADNVESDEYKEAEKDQAPLEQEANDASRNTSITATNNFLKRLGQEEIAPEVLGKFIDEIEQNFKNLKADENSSDRSYSDFLRINVAKFAHDLNVTSESNKNLKRYLDCQTEFIKGGQNLAFKIIEKMGGDTTKLKELHNQIGDFENNLRKDKSGKILQPVEIDKTSALWKNQEKINEMMEGFKKQGEANTKFMDAVEKQAAKTSTETKSSMFRKIFMTMAGLFGLGLAGFTGWWVWQQSRDNTGCFSYVGTLGAHKMGCSDEPIKDFNMPENCNCGGGFKPDQKSQKAIITGTAGTTITGHFPPNFCALGQPQMKVLGGGNSYATCTTSVTDPKAVLYAYKETSALQALSDLPAWLGKMGSGLLGDLTGGLGGIFKIILYIGLAIVGCIILLMVIRFAWNKFRGSKGGGSSNSGGGKTIVIEEGGGSSRRKS